MSRLRRTDAVLRVRALQERIAEAEAVARRRAVDEQQGALEIAHRDLETRSRTAGGITTAERLVGHRAVTAVAVDEIDRQTHRLDRARIDSDQAEVAWRDAHRRHEAVDRLDQRLRATNAAEETRVAQLELDDLVVVRHARANDEEVRLR